MLFTELRDLKNLVVEFNALSPVTKAEFFNPHMFQDGQWAVVIVFSGIIGLDYSERLLSYCLSRSLHAFWGVVNGKIALFVQ